MHPAIEKFTEIKKVMDRRGGERDLAKHIKDFTYSDYMHSPVWQVISDYCRIIQPKCIKCDSEYRLEVHHIRYTNFGLELWHLEDLTVFCSSCHTICHQLLDAAKKSKKAVPSEWVNIKNIQDILNDKGNPVHEMVQT